MCFWFIYVPFLYSYITIINYNFMIGVKNYIFKPLPFYYFIFAHDMFPNHRKKANLCFTLYDLNYLLKSLTKLQFFFFFQTLDFCSKRCLQIKWIKSQRDSNIIMPSLLWIPFLVTFSLLSIWDFGHFLTLMPQSFYFGIHDFLTHLCLSYLFYYPFYHINLLSIK